MARAQIYPPADRSAQWFADRYRGAQMDVNCGVLHTTETSSWPGYGGGATAPTLTVLPDARARKLRWRQHFPVDMSARALRNLSGGVETNTANVVQVELIGTCDPIYARRYPEAMLWPEAPDWALSQLAEFLAWCRSEHGVPLQGPDMWLAYGPDPRRPGVWPASYGDSPARMSFTQWRRFVGWCGHQHVPENSHGDPGALDFARLISMARDIDAGRTPSVPPVEEQTDRPDNPPLTDRPEEDTVTPEDFDKIREIVRAEVQQAIGRLPAAVWAHQLPDPAEPGKTRSASLLLGYTRRHVGFLLALSKSVAEQLRAGVPVADIARALADELERRAAEEPQ